MSGEDLFFIWYAGAVATLVFSVLERDRMLSYAGTLESWVGMFCLWPVTMPLYIFLVMRDARNGR